MSQSFDCLSYLLSFCKSVFQYFLFFEIPNCLVSFALSYDMILSNVA